MTSGQITSALKALHVVIFKGDGSMPRVYIRNRHLKEYLLKEDTLVYKVIRIVRSAEHYKVGKGQSKDVE